MRSEQFQKKNVDQNVYILDNFTAQIIYLIQISTS